MASSLSSFTHVSAGASIAPEHFPVIQEYSDQDWRVCWEKASEMLRATNKGIRAWSIPHEFPSIYEMRSWLDHPVNKVVFKEVNKLDFSFLELKSMPLPLRQFSALTVLNLSNNQLNSLPENLKELKSLEELNLSNNRVSCLPEALGNLPRLQHINAINNPLCRTTIPDNIRHIVLHESLTEASKTILWSALFQKEASYSYS